MSAVQSYYPVSGGFQGRSPGGQRLEPGVLLMEGDYSTADRTIALKPRQWLHQPNGHSPLRFKVAFDDADTRLSGAYMVEGCGAVTLEKAH